MRFYVPNVKSSARLMLTGEAHTHAAYALRIRVGDNVTVFDGDGTDYFCRVEDIKKDKTLLTVLDTAHNVGETELDVSLYLAVIKQDRFEIAVQKATELGVKHIIPVYTAYSQRNLKLNHDRLNKIAVSACEQCRRSVIPVVEQSIGFDELLLRAEKTCMIFPWEHEQQTTLNEAVDKSANAVSIFVGPEGGIASEEAQQLIKTGAIPVTLGKRILRAETAVIATLSVVYYEMGEWNL